VLGEEGLLRKLNDFIFGKFVSEKISLCYRGFVRGLSANRSLIAANAGRGSETKTPATISPTHVGKIEAGAARSAYSTQREISSKATSRVRGPNTPIAIITTIIAPEIKINTPCTPNSLKHAAMINAENTADMRLHE